MNVDTPHQSIWVARAAIFGFGLALAGCAAVPGDEGQTGSIVLATYDFEVDVATGVIREVGQDGIGSLSREVTDITVDADGTPGTSSMPDVVELVTEDVSSMSSVPDDCPGGLAAYPETFCGVVRLRSFYDTEILGDAFVEFTSLTAGARLENGMTKSPGSSGLDHLTGLLRYGVLTEDGDDFDSTIRLWEFSVPTGTDRFSFSAAVKANVFASGRPNLLASVTNRGNAPPNGLYANPAVSTTGRYVVFETRQALLPIDTDFSSDIYRYDRDDGSVELVSVSDSGATSGNGASTEPVLSDDGNIVVFTSRASNLVMGDRNGTRRDVFVRDMSAGTTQIGSLRWNGEQSRRGSRGAENPSVSGDGCEVAFQSDIDNLVPPGEDTNGTTDVFLRRRCAGSGTTLLMSLTDGGSALPAGRFGDNPSVSDNGCRVTFETNASTRTVSGVLDRSVPRSARDVLVRDRCTGDTLLVSTRSDGTASGNAESTNSSISGDGTLVAFESIATDHVASDPNGATRDVFVRNLTTNTTVRVGGTGASFAPHVSRNGSVVVFESDASDIVTGDGNGARDVFLYQVSAATTTRISVSGANEGNGDSDHVSVNDGGTYAVFVTEASNLYDFDDNGSTDVIVRSIE